MTTNPIPFAEIKHLVKTYLDIIKPFKFSDNASYCLKTQSLKLMKKVDLFTTALEEFDAKYYTSSIISVFPKNKPLFAVGGCPLNWLTECDSIYYFERDNYRLMERYIPSQSLFPRRIHTLNYVASGGIDLNGYTLSMRSLPLIPDIESYEYKL